MAARVEPGHDTGKCRPITCSSTGSAKPDSIGLDPTIHATGE
jgi:hypothetical protein